MYFGHVIPTTEIVTTNLDLIRGQIRAGGIIENTYIYIFYYKIKYAINKIIDLMNDGH